MAIEKSRDPGAFAAFERSGWNANIRGYDAAFGGVSRQTVERMLDAAAVGPGMRVLDVCCGPAMLAAGALRRNAQPVGVDCSEEAVSLASASVPGVRFERCDAQALPFTDAAFDAVLCGYGLMHVPDPMLALREVVRVLRPGRRAAFSVWDAGGAGFTLVYEAVRSCGSMDVPLPHGPDFFQLGTPGRMEAGLQEAGFADTAAYSFHQEWQVPDADHYMAAILTGTARAAAVLAAQSSEARARVRDYIAKYLTRLPMPPGGSHLPMPAVIGSGKRPN
jgi:SAM-dependent methyltransferase